MKIKIELISAIVVFFILSGLNNCDSIFAAEPFKTFDKNMIVVEDVDGVDNGVWLGIQINELSSKIRRKMDVRTRRGVIVMDVVEDSPADKAGIKDDDIIIKFDGKTVRNPKELTSAIRKHKAGDVVTVNVERDKDQIEIEVEIGKRPDEWFSKIDIPELEKIKDIRIHGLSTDMGFGAQFQELNADLAGYFGAEPNQGVLITEIEDDSPADKAGLRAGDVILSIEGEKVKEPDKVIDILSDYEEGDVVEVEILRKKEIQTINVELEEGYGTSYFKFGKYFPQYPRIYMHKYKDNLDHYKDSMEQHKKEMKRWKDEYKEELEERINEELERNMESQKLELDRLKDELKQLKDQVLELEKKVM